MFKKFKQKFKAFMTGKSGFSLVELIVVIAIMAVMAAVLAPALLGYVERSRAQKDDSAMGEVTNAIQLSLADQNVYDELLPYAVKGNFSCYADGDTSTNTDANKIITKSPDYWLFTDEARKLDETAYFPAGSMRGATVTFKPNGKAEYILKAGVVNQIGDESTKKGNNGGAVLEDCPELYNRLRSTVGDTIKVSSQTYRNSTYTIFISMGTTGGNQADKQDAIQVYGQYNGTNLPEVMTATGSASQDKGNAGSNNGGNSNPSIQVAGATFNKCLKSPGCCVIESIFDSHSDDCWMTIEPITLTWDELKLPANGALYEYDASSIKSTYIDMQAFQGCPGIIKINIAEGVQSIGDNAFSYCNNLTEITIPNTVTNIGYDSFEGTAFHKNSANWTDDTYSALYIGNYLIDIKGDITGHYTVREGTIAMSTSLFTGKANMTGITLPEGMIAIADDAFQNCKKLENVTIPSTVKTIGGTAFTRCALKNVVLPEGLISIGNSAFSRCEQLESVVVPESVIDLGPNTFVDCVKLKTINIPKNVTVLQNSVFEGCSSLTSITVPVSVTKINQRAFFDCSKLSTFKYEGSSAQWSNVQLGTYWKTGSAISTIQCAQ